MYKCWLSYQSLSAISQQCSKTSGKEGKIQRTHLTMPHCTFPTTCSYSLCTLAERISNILRPYSRRYSIDRQISMLSFEAIAFSKKLCRFLHSGHQSVQWFGNKRRLRWLLQLIISRGYWVIVKLTKTIKMRMMGPLELSWRSLATVISVPRRLARSQASGYRDKLARVVEVTQKPCLVAIYHRTISTS